MATPPAYKTSAAAAGRTPSSVQMGAGVLHCSRSVMAGRIVGRTSREISGLTKNCLYFRSKSNFHPVIFTQFLSVLSVAFLSVLAI